MILLLNLDPMFIPAAVAHKTIGHGSQEVRRLCVNVGREAMEKAAAVLPEL